MNKPTKYDFALALRKWRNSQWKATRANADKRDVQLVAEMQKECESLAKSQDSADGLRVAFNVCLQVQSLYAKKSSHENLILRNESQRLLDGLIVETIEYHETTPSLFDSIEKGGES